MAKSEAVRHAENVTTHQHRSALEDYYFQWSGAEGVGQKEWDFMMENAHSDLFPDDYDWKPPSKGQQLKLYDFQKETVALQRQNATAQRDYAIQTQKKNYDYGLAIADYEFEQQKKMVSKRDDEVEAQKNLNQVGMEYALDRERRVLDEQFIQAAFDNTSIIQDLYEATGAAGFETTALKLGLKDKEGQLKNEKAKSLANVKQQIGNSQFATAGKQLELIDQAGKGAYTKSGLSQSLKAKEAQSKYDQYALGLDVFSAKTRADFENDMLMRQIDDQKAKAAFDTTEANVKALKAAGQAQLGQAGRSQGKAVQAFFAELGRQNALLVETLVRGQSAGNARAIQNKIGALDTEAKAMVASSKIDLQTLDNIETTNREMSEVDRGLSMTGQQGQLDLQAIRKEMEDLLENTDIDFKEIDRNLRTAQVDTALGIKKEDWSLENIGARFRTNQAVLQASLDSAAANSVANQKDIVLAKLGSDLRAESARMAEAARPTDADGNLILPPDPMEQDADGNFVNQQPMITYQDPLAPTPPPMPQPGASGGDTSNSFQQVAGAALGGATAGLGAYATAAAGLKAAGMATTAATPIGWAVGIGTFLANL